MASHRQTTDVVVIGGGIIGLAAAWRARERGMSVTLLERGAVGSGASSVAAGMLAPVSEVEFGVAGSQLLQLGLRSAASWPSFAQELEAGWGRPVGLLQTGTLMVARDADEARELERQISFRASLGLRAQRVRASRARELEPALAPTIRLALELPDDQSVDPRLVLAALRDCCVAGGVQLREQTPVARLLIDGDTVAGVELPAGQRLLAPAVVIAAGTWSGDLAGLPAPCRVPVRPVKGQILRLRDPAGPGLVRRPVRFEGGYLVPRADGGYALGATVEERGFDMRPTAGAMYQLLRDCGELVPGVSELEIEELCVGLRPGTPDNIPVIGRGALDGLLWATGHYRNGILLAPLTAQLMVDLLSASGPADPLLAVCAPSRFAAGAPRHARAPSTEAAGDWAADAPSGADRSIRPDRDHAGVGPW
jgi:glycine oxidase